MVREYCRANQKNRIDTWPRKGSKSSQQRIQDTNMDILHAQLTAIQRRLAFVQVDPIDWKTQVLVFSWGICLFESYLLYAPIHPLFYPATVVHTRVPEQPAAISALLEASSPHRPCRPLYTSGV